MSNALAIAAVTAALKDLIATGLLGLDLSAIGSVNVSAWVNPLPAASLPSHLRITVDAFRLQRAPFNQDLAGQQRTRQPGFEDWLNQAFNQPLLKVFPVFAFV